MRRWETTKDPTKPMETGGTRLARGKSLDPRNIQAFEQEAFSIIASLNSQKSEEEKSQSHSENELNVFSMENYESEKDKKAAENSSKSNCCCSKQIHPRHNSPQSKYSVCIIIF